MEKTPYQRLEIFWQSKGLKNMSAFSEAIQLKPGTLSAIKLRSSRPSNSVMKAIQNVFPDLDPEWVLWGTGTMLRDGRALTPVTPTVAEEPAAPTLVIPDVVNKLLDQLNTQGEYHKEQLRQAKKDFNRHLDASSRQWQYTVDRMEDQLNEKRETIAQLEAEVFRLKLAAGERKPTPVEIEAMEKQAAPAKRTAVKGLRSYEEEVPELVEMVAVRGESDFSRLRVLEQEECHLKAA